MKVSCKTDSELLSAALAGAQARNSAAPKVQQTHINAQAYEGRYLFINGDMPEQQ